MVGHGNQIYATFVHEDQTMYLTCSMCSTRSDFTLFNTFT